MALRSGILIALTAAMAVAVARPALADDLPCTTVRSGDVAVPSIDCLNDRLSQMAAADRFASEPAPGFAANDAIGHPDRVGETTIAGASLRFGKTFGVGAQPFRPGSPASFGNAAGLAGRLPPP
jgi:hypothetical protein